MQAYLKVLENAATVFFKWKVVHGTAIDTCSKVVLPKIRAAFRLKIKMII